MGNKENIIEDEFNRLKDVGEFLKFMSDTTENSTGNTPFAFEQAVRHLSKEAIEALNDAMKGLSKEFPENEFEPIRLD